MDLNSLDSVLKSVLRFQEQLEKMVSRKEQFIAEEQQNYEKNARLFVESEEKYEKLTQRFTQEYSGVPFIEYSQEDIIEFFTLELDIERYMWERDSTENVLGYERNILMPLLLEQKEGIEKIIGEYLQRTRCNA